MSQATKDDLERIETTLRTLIIWMAQSANSPINRTEAQTLLKMLAPPLAAPEPPEHKKKS